MTRTNTRRRFLVNCSVLSAGAFAPASVWALPSRQTLAALDRISYEDFSACAGTRFRVVLPGAPDVRLELFKAQPRPLTRADFTIAGTQDAANEKFSLVFRGALNKPLAQDSYVFAHPRTGRFLLFIVPVIAKDTTHRYYEAVFNRPQSSERSAKPQSARLRMTSKSPAN